MGKLRVLQSIRGPTVVTELSMVFPEFHRWNHRKIDDGERMIAVIQASEGKRLSYKPLTKH
jgi:hypothetical protein